MCTLFPGGIEPQPIKLEFTIYPAELWIWGGAGEGSEHNRTFWPRLHMFWPLLHVGEGVGVRVMCLGWAGCKVTGGMREVTCAFLFFFFFFDRREPAAGERSGA